MRLLPFLLGAAAGAVIVAALRPRRPRLFLFRLISLEDLDPTTYPSHSLPNLAGLCRHIEEGDLMFNLSQPVGKRGVYQLKEGADKFGNAAPFEGLEVSTNNEPVGKIVALPDVPEGGGALLQIDTPGLAGSAQLTVTADGHIGDGIVPLTLVINLTALPGDAVSFGDLTPVSLEDIPPAV